MVSATVHPIRGSADSHGVSWSPELRAKVKACEREADHVYGPDGYLQWHAWADEMRKAGWKQQRCECGLFLLLVPPKPKAGAGDDGSK